MVRGYSNYGFRFLRSYARQGHARQIQFALECPLAQCAVEGFEIGVLTLTGY
jgi:hypothetical protein